MIAHKVSIGFKSRELPGQPRTVNLAFWKKFAFFWRCGTVCCLAEKCHFQLEMTSALTESILLPIIPGI